MARPTQPRPITEHLLVVARMARSIEADDQLAARRKNRLLQLLAQLTTELQKELP